MLNNNNSRVIAHKAICLVALEKHTLSESLFPTENSEASFAKSLTYGSLRFYHHLNDVITPRLKKTLDKKNLDIHILMILGAYQLIYTDISTHAAINETVEVAEKIQKQWAKGLINAILRGIDRDRDEILNTTHYSHPSWLVKKIMKEYPDDYHKIFVENNKKAPMSIRVHPSINIKSYKDKLLEKNIESKTSVIAPQSLTLDKAVNVEKLPDFKNGSCYIQDTSAQLAGQLIAPKKGELILKRGRYIRASEIGLLASLGLPKISVYRQIKVAFLLRLHSAYCVYFQQLQHLLCLSEHKRGHQTCLQ